MAFDNDGATDVSMNFMLWLNSELNIDGVLVRYSINGTTYTLVGSLSGNTAGWQNFNVDFSPAAKSAILGQSQVRFAVQFFSDAANQMTEGAYIDDLIIQKKY